MKLVLFIFLLSHLCHIIVSSSSSEQEGLMEEQPAGAPEGSQVNVQIIDDTESLGGDSNSDSSSSIAIQRGCLAEIIGVAKILASLALIAGVIVILVLIYEYRV